VNSQALLNIVLIAVSVGFFGMWNSARNRAKDFETDLRTLVVRNDLDSRDLRRSLRHKSFRKFVVGRSDEQVKEALEKADLSKTNGDFDGE